MAETNEGTPVSTEVNVKMSQVDRLLSQYDNTSVQLAMWDQDGEPPTTVKSQMEVFKRSEDYVRGELEGEQRALALVLGDFLGQGDRVSEIGSRIRETYQPKE